MSKRAPTFYVLHGSDEFSCKAQLQAMRAQMGDSSMAELNTSIFDGKTASAHDVLNAARSTPFLSDKRLVIVEGMLSWLARKGASKADKAAVETLTAGLIELPDTARLVFVEREMLSEKNAILQLAKTAPGGFHREFNPPSNEEHRAKWIVNQARENYGAIIEGRAAALLAAMVDTDMRAADSEIAKLALYVNGERPINEQDVTLLSAYKAEADVFEMVDALGRRDAQAALRLLHRLLVEDDPLRLFGMVVRQFRLLLLAREHLNSGGSAGQLAQALGVHPYVAQKITAQVRAFSLEQLEQIYHFLLETDAGIKTGKVGDVLALDLLVAGLS
ncbi:MAG: DNA polymerase III subunit delta [Chloroflexi bacterium]|nr:DNA polymerase III subunit delta [Chloroflexota bacterium]